ncbi:branched-chain amino acid ABC transporter permease [Hamadaea tsunoensis]|uniref:branched-chain amino acid ABC transporter permease n=1 Tax=Hamadaea tsunoensis TaxID=53368 RepID=UPI000419456D|nr:branched-chain amino acid ABC transporter permease [Hamadaea tsunoensis]
MQIFFQTLIGGVSLGAVYALVALGFSLVYRTMGLVNFSHGNVVMIGAYMASTFYLTAKLPFALATVIAMAVTGLIGVIIERVLRPLENKDFDLMLIGTIGFGIVLEALATLVWGATGRAVPSPVPAAPLDLFGIKVRTYDLVVLAIAAAATALLMLFLQRTKRGAAMQAVAMDHEAATAVGIHVGRSNAIAFVLGAALAALAGSLVGPLLYVSPTMGGTLGIKGFAGAILGGFGSIPGAIAGGIAIGVLDSFAAGHFQGYSELVTFLVFTILIVIRPTGIFGERTVNRA